MNKVSKLTSGGVYIFRGLINANSLEFEDKEDAVLFLTLLNKYLGNYLEIIEYALTIEGWELLVKIKDKRTLKKHILNDSNSSHASEWSVSRIIGERIRHFRSTFRNRLNKKQNRKGIGIRCRYEKFIIRDLSEAIQRIEELRSGQINIGQPEERFRADETFFDGEGNLEKDKKQGVSILTSEAIRRKGIEWIQNVHKIKLRILYLLDVQENVLHKLILYTKKAHNFQT